MFLTRFYWGNYWLYKCTIYFWATGFFLYTTKLHLVVVHSLLWILNCQLLFEIINHGNFYLIMCRMVLGAWFHNLHFALGTWHSRQQIRRGRRRRRCGLPSRLRTGGRQALWRARQSPLPLDAAAVSSPPRCSGAGLLSSSMEQLCLRAARIRLRPAPIHPMRTPPWLFWRMIQSPQPTYLTSKKSRNLSRRTSTLRWLKSSKRCRGS
jgi:hypothetical protein